MSSRQARTEPALNESGVVPSPSGITTAKGHDDEGNDGHGKGLFASAAGRQGFEMRF